MNKLFGTDGMRGYAGQFPLDRATIARIGASLTKHFFARLNRKPRFIVGRDTRESGEWIEKAFFDGVTVSGGECQSAGIITTPGIAFLTAEFDFDAGVVISASHNPFEDNGIKIFSPSGKKIDGETERSIEKDIFEFSAEEIDASNIEINAEKTEIFQNAYLRHLQNNFQQLSLNNFKVIVDCANGAASRLAPELFASFGGEVVTINDQPNGKNINYNCGSLYLEQLQSKVVEEKADFGVAFDGDADRALFVDEQGNLVDGDATLWIMANYLESHGKLHGHKVVATVMSNIGGIL